MTLIEAVVAVSILAVLLVLVAVSLTRDSQALSSMVEVSTVDLRAREMVARIEEELEFAQGTAPEARLTADLGPGEAAEARVDDSDGFPDSGFLLLQPGTAAEERIAYDGLSAAGDAFRGLTRGEQCTDAAFHVGGLVVRWAGAARAIDDQGAPPVEFYDGISRETNGPVFFRGDGSGFSFRVPTDPAGGMDFLDDDEVRWGAKVRGRGTLDGWSALSFEAVASVTEAVRDFDFNADGDLDDEFDLGRIRVRSWDTAAPGAGATDVALCPPIVLQERCAWGADLDADGFADPMFLWTPASGRLRVRLFVLEGQVNQRPQVRRLETVLFLRNGAVE